MSAIGSICRAACRRTDPAVLGRGPVKASQFAASALLAAIAAPSLAPAQQDPARASVERCYGIAKAGLNDCQTATHSCAGTSIGDADGASWIYVPVGSCLKIAGGSIMPKA